MFDPAVGFDLNASYSYIFQMRFCSERCTTASCAAARNLIFRFRVGNIHFEAKGNGNWKLELRLALNQHQQQIN